MHEGHGAFTGLLLYSRVMSHIFHPRIEVDLTNYTANATESLLIFGFRLKITL